MDWGLALALGLSLSLDAFAVSCAIPFAVPQISWPQALRVAGTFGIFQALMPLAGWMAADEFCDRLGLSRDLAGDYDTVAGLVLHQMRRLPALGDSFTVAGHRFEVIDLDGLRIDKVLVSAV